MGWVCDLRALQEPHGSIAAFASKMAAGSMLEKNFAPLFPITLMEKDLGYALAAAVGEGMPLAQATRDVFTKATDAGHGDDNMSGVVQLYIPDGDA